MGKKKRNAEAVESERQINTPLIIVGVIVVALAVVVGSIIGTILLVGVDEEEPVSAAVPEFIADAPEIERSSVADLLESTSFNDMSQDEREQVKAEVNRVFDDAEFRVTGQFLDGLDVVRRDGTTRASRNYALAEAPGGYTTTITTSFYCDGEDDFIDLYQTEKTVASTTPNYNRINDGQQPFERALSDTDWTNAEDLGVKEVDGREARGVAIDYMYGEAQTYRVEAWFDIENARLLRYTQLEESGEPSLQGALKLDWRVPPRIEPEPELSTPPCAAALYD